MGEESYWCEITGRTDVGADLRCPQADEGESEQTAHACENAWFSVWKDADPDIPSPNVVR